MRSTEGITERVSLSTAALRLGVSYTTARDRVLRHELIGGRDSDGRWYVEGNSLERAIKTATREKQSEAVSAA